MRLELISWCMAPGPDYQLKIRRHTGWWIFQRQDEFTVRGDCTVWQYFPSAKRCGTFLESELCDIWQRIKWKQHDDLRVPDAS